MLSTTIHAIHVVLRRLTIEWHRRTSELCLRVGIIRIRRIGGIIGRGTELLLGMLRHALVLRGHLVLLECRLGCIGLLRLSILFLELIVLITILVGKLALHILITLVPSLLIATTLLAGITTSS